MSHWKKKQSLTLLEIMIVIFLIGLIGSVIGYNMKGSLEEGKAFKTRQAQEQIHDILMLEVAKGEDMSRVIGDPEAFLKHSNLIKDPKKLIVDGWGKPFEITANQYNTDIIIKSDSLASYEHKQREKVSSK